MFANLKVVGADHIGGLHAAEKFLFENPALHQNYGTALVTLKDPVN